MMMTTENVAAEVWIGCFACYNSGDLVGRWELATDADTVTVGDIHEAMDEIAPDVDWSDHEELWCFDSERLPITGECSPMDAAEWGRLLDDVPDWQMEALHAWIRSGDYVMQGDGPLPSLPDFEERYAGYWPSMTAYADSLMDETGMWEEVPEWARPYLCVDKFAADLNFDHTTEPASGGGVHVFRSL